MRKIIKKATALLMALVMTMAGALTASAQPTPEELGLIPIRATFEGIEAEVYWSDEDRSIHITLTTGEVFVFFADLPVAFVEGLEVPLPNGVVIIEDTSFIPFEDFTAVNDALVAMLGETHLGVTIFDTTNIVNQVMGLLAIPGMTVAIVDADNGFTWIYGFGYADTLLGTPVDEFTLFNLASISKPFTAMAVMQLVEQGIIDLDEPIVTYLPNFNVPTDFIFGTGDYRNITVRMLLSHASGIQNDFAASGVLTSGGYYPGYMDNFVEFLSGFQMVTPEAAMFSYNNNAFTLLGVLVAEMSGASSAFDGFVSYMDENIFAPLGMDLSTFEVGESHRPYLAMSYRDSATREEFLYYNALPTGGLFSNARDMSRFMHAILGGGELEGSRVLAEATLRQMMTPQVWDFEGALDFTANFRPGLGFVYATELSGFSHWGHGGNLVHYHSHLAFDMENGLGVFASVNSVSGMQVPMSTLVPMILQMARVEKTGDPGVPESDLTVEPIELSLEELQAFEGVYTLSGASDFMLVEATDGGTLMFSVGEQQGELLPLSDGSFIFPMTGIRYWFVEVYGEMVLFLGEFRSVIAGQRLPVDYVLATEAHEQWFGEYYPVTEGNHISLFTRATVGVDENGIPFIRMYALHDMSPIAPLIEVGENNFGGIRFSIQDGEAVLEFSGVRMVRR